MNDKAVCKHCGFLYRDHARSDNAYCPKGRCPGDRWPRSMQGYRATQWPDWHIAQEQLKRFWNERQTLFEELTDADIFDQIFGADLNDDTPVPTGDE